MSANTARLARRMDEMGVDAIVATTLENVRYLTGVSSVTLEIFPHTGECFAVAVRDRLTRPHLITSRCDLDQAIDAGTDLGSATGYGAFYRERPEAAGTRGGQGELGRQLPQPDHRITAELLGGEHEHVGRCLDTVDDDELAAGAQIAGQPHVRHRIRRPDGHAHLLHRASVGARS